MNAPARRVRLLGEAQYRDQGEDRLREPGDAVVIRRGPLRSLLMCCPDGCGAILSINLDPRAGKAWELDLRLGEPTLYPSVWREGGCGSHFIVWRGRILWSDLYQSGNEEPPYDASLEDRVYTALDPSRFNSARQIAKDIDELPWEVARAARQLVRRGLVVAGSGNRKAWFRKRL